MNTILSVSCYILYIEYKKKSDIGCVQSNNPLAFPGLWWASNQSTEKGRHRQNPLETVQTGEIEVKLKKKKLQKSLFLFFLYILKVNNNNYPNFEKYVKPKGSLF